MRADCPACGKEFRQPVMERVPPFLGKLSVRCPPCQAEIQRIPKYRFGLLEWSLAGYLLLIQPAWYTLAFPSTLEYWKLINLALASPLVVALGLRAYRERGQKEHYTLVRGLTMRSSRPLGKRLDQTYCCRTAAA